MAKSLLLCGILLTCVFISVEAQGGNLTCRICREASYLEDCDEIQVCLPDEECYIDEVITERLQIVFNAGCRAKTVCQAVERQNKRDLLACSRCCNSQPSWMFRTECNTKLCGLMIRGLDYKQCYYCGNYIDAKQGAVTDPKTCRRLKLCPDDEVCSVTTKNTGGVTTYELGCKPLLECQIHTIAYLELQGVHTGIDLVQLAGSGTLNIIGKKRQRNICDICCGDGLCNDDSCESMRRRLVTFANANKLNYTSLKIMV